MFRSCARHKVFLPRSLSWYTLTPSHIKHTNRQVTHASSMSTTSSSKPQQTPEQNVAMMHRLIYEVQEKGDITLIDELWHPDFVNHTAIGGAPADKSGVAPTLQWLHSAFKEIKMEIIQCIAQGNVVATNKVLRGRQVQDFMGHKAEGKLMEFPIMDFVTIEDGLIKEHWARSGPVKLLE